MLDPGFLPVANNTSTISSELRFTGRRTDPETGLQLNRNRFYASHLGRWVNRDPIGYEGGTNNLYEYVGSDPVFWVDPQGLETGGGWQKPGGGGPIDWPPKRRRPRPRPRWPMTCGSLSYCPDPDAKPIGPCIQKNWEAAGYSSPRDCMVSLVGDANEPAFECLLAGGAVACCCPPVGIGMAAGFIGQACVADNWCRGCFK